MPRTLVATLAFLLSSVVTALAGPIPRNALDADTMAWFYNQPGTTTAKAAEDLTACEGFSGGILPSPAGVGLGFDILNAGRYAGTFRAGVDDCMVALGYRRYETNDARLSAFQARYNTMTDEAKLAIVGGDPPPEGRLARQWANSFWISDQHDPQGERRRIAHPIAVPNPMSWPQWRVIYPVAGVSSPPASADAVLVMSLTFESSAGAYAGFYFQRDNAMTGLPDPFTRGRTQELVMFGVSMGERPQWLPRRSGAALSIVSRGVGQRLLFVVPPGTYALTSVLRDETSNSAHFCLGTIAFQAQAGEALFLGNYRVVAADQNPGPANPPAPLGIRIDPGDIEFARSSLLGAPEFAMRLHQAEYWNGHVSGCFSGQGALPIYGIDLPGAPWGRQTSAAPSE